MLSDAVTGQGLDLTDSNGDTAAFLVDGIGNQVGTLTDAGSQGFTASYDPYGTGGVTIGATNPFWTQNPFGFKVGARASQTQNTIVRFGLRWYLPTTGTWTQRDTLDAPLDPNNADRYAYAGDDPANGGDSSGRAAYQAGLKGCYFLCISLGVEWNESGDVALTGGVGAGNPSLTGSLGATTANPESGAGGSVTCSAGPASLSYGTSGDFSGALGTSYSTGECDVSADGSLQIAGS